MARCSGFVRPDINNVPNTQYKRREKNEMERKGKEKKSVRDILDSAVEDFTIGNPDAQRS